MAFVLPVALHGNCFTLEVSFYIEREVGMRRLGVFTAFMLFSFMSVSFEKKRVQSVSLGELQKVEAAEAILGKDVFLKYKCDACHSVSTAGIKGKKDKGPDLVNETKRHEIAWLRSFIKKEAEHVSCIRVPKERDGKMHALKFKGTKEEEDALMNWIDVLCKDD